MIPILLYTKENCSLCEDAKAILAHFQGRFPYRLTEVDITTDPALYERYRYRIPVFDIAGQELAAPITPAALQAALQRA